ncbi:MAG: MFS transporter [Verrucomicrobium sp.]
MTKSPLHPSQHPKDLPWGLAWRIAIGQIVAWGTLFYGFSVIAGPMETSTGWSKQFINAGLSLGLLVWGIGAAPVGSWIQRNGGHSVMTLGSLVGGLSLILMGGWVNPVVYVASWITLGAAMAALLYEPAFAVITVAFHSHYKRGIILITLVAGLASSVFIPATAYLVKLWDWRSALITLGIIQLFIGVPLHYFGMPRGLIVEGLQTVSLQIPLRLRLKNWLAGLRQELTDRRFICLAFWFSTHAAAFSGLTFLLIPMNKSLAFDPSTLMFAIALIGPMQITGRLVLAFYGEHFSALQVGAWAMASLILAAGFLLIHPPSVTALFLFAMLYGTGNGLMTIVKGTAVAELFGRERYAELNGLLAAPAVLAKAGSPLLLAALWSATDSPRVAIASVMVLLFAGFVCLLGAKEQRD